MYIKIIDYQKIWEKILVENQKILEEIKYEKSIFISDILTTSNWWQCIERSHLPLNNIFLNPLMERIRKLYL